MYTSIAVVALAGFVIAPATPQADHWHLDYHQAKRIGRVVDRPLAVIVGQGEKGYEKLSGNGRLTPAAKKLLAENYVCVYVDVASPKGRELAAALEIQQTNGIVLSDREGNHQAFHHDGTISDELLERYLARFSDPDVVVERTTTIQRVSYYPPATTAPPQGSYTPAYPTYAQPPIFSGGFGGSGRC